MQKVWDIYIRLFHWLLVGSIGFAWWSAEQGDYWMEWHMYSGYCVLGLVIFRVLWGFIGSHCAKFGSFIYSPTTVFKYVKALVTGTGATYIGHNPLGGWAVVLLLAFCAIQALTGLFSTDDIMLEGPLLSAFGYDLTRLHKQFFDVLLGLIALHIVAVLFHQIFFRERLIQGMISGKKETSESVEAVVKAEGSVTGLIVRGLAAVVLATAAVWGIISL